MSSTTLPWCFRRPTPVFVGEAITPQEVAARLRKGLYAESEGGSRRWHLSLGGNRLEIRPGPASFFQSDGFKQGRRRRWSFQTGTSSPSPHFPAPTRWNAIVLNRKSSPRCLTVPEASGGWCATRIFPSVSINAVVAAEDHSFFSHHGVNLYRIFASGVHDFFRADEIMQGGSTLTMHAGPQHLRAYPAAEIQPQNKPGVSWPILLEQRLNKEQIFELFANQVYLGQRGGFSIYGFRGRGQRLLQ
jgi:penicillin-binding protein 1B